jgi:hypothetical protein
MPDYIRESEYEGSSNTSEKDEDKDGSKSPNLEDDVGDEGNTNLD